MSCGHSLTEGEKVTGQFSGSHLWLQDLNPTFRSRAWMAFFNETISILFTYVNFKPTEFIIHSKYYVY